MSIKQYDENGRLIYSKYDGYEEWYDYDEFGKLIRYRNSNGITKWYNTLGKCIRMKIIIHLNKTRLSMHILIRLILLVKMEIYILNFSKYDYILVTE